MNVQKKQTTVENKILVHDLIFGITGENKDDKLERIESFIEISGMNFNSFYEMLKTRKRNHPFKQYKNIKICLN